MGSEVRTGSTWTKSVFSQCAAWLVVATAAAAAYRRVGIASRDPLPAAYFVVQLAFFVVLRLAL